MPSAFEADRDEPCLTGDQGIEVVEHEFARMIHRQHAHGRAGLRRGELPRHDVRMMLELAHENLVAGAEQGAQIRLCDEVDRLGRAAHEHELPAARRVDERRDAVARALVGRGRAFGQRVHAAVHVRIVEAVVGAPQ